MSRFGDGYLYAKRELAKPAGIAMLLQNVECAKDMGTFDEFDKGILKAMSDHAIADAQIAVTEKPKQKSSVLKHSLWLLVLAYLASAFVVGSFDIAVWTTDQRFNAISFYSICVWLRVLKEYL